MIPKHPLIEKLILQGQYRQAGPSFYHDGDLLIEAAKEIENLQKQLNHICEKFNECIYEFEDASQYKGEYLAWKHGDKETIEEYRKALNDIGWKEKNNAT